MLHDTSVSRYSAVVTLQLLVNGHVYPLAQTAPDFVILKEPATIPAGPGTVVTIVDGNERRSDVIILESPESQATLSVHDLRENVYRPSPIAAIQGASSRSCAHGLRL